jgi:hypothetical protein
LLVYLKIYKYLDENGSLDPDVLIRHHKNVKMFFIKFKGDTLPTALTLMHISGGMGLYKITKKIFKGKNKNKCYNI